MNIVLVGHPGSQFLVPASRYLTEKYLPGFHIQYWNHTDHVSEWSAFLRKKLRLMTGPLVIFSLDDYLISGPMNMDIYESAVNKFSEDDVRCVKLFECTDQEHAEYPVTTQYTIWDRRFLIKLLDRTSDPWNFEMNGSRLFSSWGGISVKLPEPAIRYNTSSALSGRWRGVRFDGLSEQDRAEVQRLIS